MSFEELKEKAKEHGVKIGWTTKGLYKQVADAIVDGETVAAIAEGHTSPSVTPVIVTDRSVYIAHYSSAFTGLDIVRINRQIIESVHTVGTLLKSLAIDTAGGSYAVEAMGPQDAQRIAKILS